MKKILPLILVFFALTGCKVKDYTPEIPAVFKENAVVTSGDFSYTCEICRNETCVIVNITSTNAQGLSMTYDGDILQFNYSDFAYDINGKNFEKTNPAIVIYDVFYYINTASDLNVKKIDAGFKYEGEAALGSFVLIQNDDNSLSSLTFRQTDYVITFE